MTTKTTSFPKGKNYILEKRAGIWCVVERGGGVRPASFIEQDLWEKLYDKN